jgi:hypothetical protein
MRCPGKLKMELGLPDEPNDFSDEGTAAHEIARRCLEYAVEAATYRGERVDLGHRTYEVTAEMCEYVQIYVDQIHTRIQSFVAAGASSVNMLVETRVDFSSFVGQPDSFGTADVILLAEWPNGQRQLDINDLKFGRGVLVNAAHNEQLMTYALGAYDQFAALGPVEIISMAIHQPRKAHYDEWWMSEAELLDFGTKLGEAADVAVAMLKGDMPLKLVPGDDQCRWCKAKATCPALREHVLEELTSGFIDTDEDPAPQIATISEKLMMAGDERLDDIFPAIPLIEIWLKAVRAEIERRLLAGIPFRNCKVVQGKKGNRSWTDPAAAELVLKSMRIKEDSMYERKLVSPTTVEKVLKDSPKRWTRLQPLISQSDGPLSVAPTSDRRPAIAITPLSEIFDDLPEDDLA